MFKTLIPKETQDSIFSIDLVSLHKRGYKNILIDIDNTIIPWKTHEVSDRLKTWIKSSQREGFLIYLFSNSRSHRVNKVSKDLGIPAIPMGGKPFTHVFKKALGHIGGKADNTIMVGDQIFTDILGGNLAGLYTILVEPISKEEFLGTKVNRFLERVLAGRGKAR